MTVNLRTPRETVAQRHFAILRLLRRGRGASLRELATALDVSVRTIRRDLFALEYGDGVAMHHEADDVSMRYYLRECPLCKAVA